MQEKLSSAFLREASKHTADQLSSMSSHNIKVKASLYCEETIGETSRIKAKNLAVRHSKKSPAKIR